MNISEKKIVTVKYDLYVPTEGGEPELMESATTEKPLTFCYGIGMMLAKFEQELSGLKLGDKFDFTIPCAEGYGEYNDEHVVDLPKNIFEVDGKFDTEMIFVGNVVPLMDADGNRFNAEVTAVNDETVTVDLNHPLAGEDLHFIGEILDVHEASDEEIQSYLGGGCGGSCDCEGDCDEEGHATAGGCGGSCGCH
ncbi:MAG: FKBP-type peptidyl-prolyl cis-trans isomerase [Paludibacteraceae bacterium]|nr:FKBP-type peptidyl-prolyl cis-trans isomerase [Paludibacteraceae bacterium]